MEIQTIAIYADIALAAYADLILGGLSVQDAQLKQAGFANAQSTRFADLFSVVVPTYHDTVSDLDVTVFKDVAGNLTLGIRGTLPGHDLNVTDAQIASSGAGYDQIVALYNWWQRASNPAGMSVNQFVLVEYPTGVAPVGSLKLFDTSLAFGGAAMYLRVAPAASATGQLTAALAADPDHKIDVTGHSLGAHLALAFNALFSSSVGQAVGFDTPGFLSGTTNEKFFAALGGMVPTAINSANFVNVIADESGIGERPFSAIAGVWSRPGIPVNISIENQWLSDEPVPESVRNHSMKMIADSFAVFSLLNLLDPNLDTSTYKRFLNVAANGTAASYERIVDSLESIFNVNQTLLSVGNAQRDALYAGLFGLSANSDVQSLVGKIRVDISSAGLAAIARNEFSALASLITLSPIVLTGVDAALETTLKNVWGNTYDAWQIDKNSSTPVSFTDNWISDRSKMLALIVDRNKADLQGISPGTDNLHYYDAASNTDVLVGSGSTLRKKFLFGGDDADSLTGSGLVDHLYGGASADNLSGVGGNDYLQGDAGDDLLNGGQGADSLAGGVGTDIYQFTTGDGRDTITDSDGNGTITVDGTSLTGGKKVSGNVWESADKAVVYTVIGGTLVIGERTAPGSSSVNGTITITGWDQMQGNHLGITLQDADTPAPAPAPTNIVDGTENPDDLSGTAASDLIRGFAGSDLIEAGQGGNDWIDAGADVDLASGSAGNDTILGGAGRDVVLGMAGDDEVWGGQRSDFASVNDQTEPASDSEADFLAGSIGNDSLYGGASNDLFLGGGGRDLIVAGAGDDNIFGDETFTTVYRDTWQDTRSSTADASGNVTYLQTFAGFDTATSLVPDADTVYAGAGSDWVNTAAGDDYVDAGTGNDLVWGGAGADIIDGADGDDELIGDGEIDNPSTLTYVPLAEHGSDIIYGGAGSDTIFGDGADDYVDGEDGNDMVRGGAGNDEVFGGGGDDDLLGDDRKSTAAEHGDDYLDGEDGNDNLSGQGGSDELFGGAGNDYLMGDDSASLLDGQYHGKDYVDGEDGDDTLFGGGGEDTLFGGAGNDQLYGDDGGLAANFHGNDYLDGEDGDDSVAGQGGTDTLRGGAGNDSLYGGAGDDTLLGGIGNDRLYGDDSSLDSSLHGYDYIDGEDGDDSVSGQGGNDTLLGSAGNDSLYGGAGDDSLLGGIGNDQLSSDDGADFLDGADGADLLFGGNGNDSLFGSIGNDSLIGDAGDDVLDGDVGVDQLQGGDGADTLRGGLDGDLLFGDAGNDSLDGGDGNDEVSGNDGNDLVAGGAGADRLFGDAGNDTLTGSSGNDELQGGANNDLLQGGADNDTLFGQDGVDRLEAGSGNDQLQGGNGDDVLLAEDGNDDLYGEAGNDSLEGAAGDDWLEGGDANDTLVGGQGFDQLNGGAGNDVYVFAPNDSSTDVSLAEIVSDLEGVNLIRLVGDFSIDSMTLTPRAGGFLELQTGHGIIEIAGLTSQYMDAGNIGSVEVGGVVYTASQFYGKTYAWNRSGTYIDFAQGGKLSETLTTQNQNSTFVGGGGDDILNGKYGKNTYRYDFGDGSDTINDTSPALDFLGRPQSSTVAFGSGITTGDIRLSTAPGAFVISFANQPGSIRITGFDLNNASQHTPIDRFTFADGSELTHAQLIARGFEVNGTSAAESLSGTNLADRLTGGGGSDTIAGGAGADTYTFNIGDGIDVIADGDAAAGIGDTLTFGQDIAVSDVRATRNGNDVTFLLPSDRVTLRDYFAGGTNAIEQIAFADGTQWTQSNVLSVLTASAGDSVLVGDGGNNAMQGFDGNDSIDGGAGDDTLLGGGGNDTLVGAAGMDFLNGQGGGDTYIVGLTGNASDVIDETIGGDAASVDTVQFVDGLHREDVSIQRDGNDILLTSQQLLSLRIVGQYASDAGVGRIENFVFADGTTMLSDELKAALIAGSNGFDTSDLITGDGAANFILGQGGNDTLLGAAGNDTVYGGAGNDSLLGETGNDFLNGEDGNDTLNAGAGWDRLDAGAGDDVYVFGAGYGNDIITADAGGTDQIRLAAGITSANVTLYRVSAPPAGDMSYQSDSLVIQLNNGADQLWVANYFGSSNAGYIESIAFADGTTWTYSAVMSALVGGSVNTASGTTRANAFTVDHWNDVINDPTVGDADTVSASVSYHLPANVNNITLTGTLNFFALGGTGSDLLTGNAGSNWYTFILGDGSDTLAGGKGDDVYVVSAAKEDWQAGASPTNYGGASIVELAGEGIDTLVSSFWSAQLPGNVENLVMTDPNSRDRLYISPWSFNDFTHQFIGNTSNNTIDASDYERFWQNFPYTLPGGFYTMGEFRLDGGSGADTLIGGYGNDTYVIDNAGDVVVETYIGSPRSDTVETPFETSLLTQFPNIENITLIGAAAVNATGNAFANRLDGSLNTSGNRLTGGAGDDTYVIGAGDTVVELTGEGVDTVVVASASGATVRLADYQNIENIRLKGSAGALNVEGDSVSNEIVGSTGNNWLSGYGGNDSIADQNVADITFYSGVAPSTDNDLLEGGDADDLLESYGGVDTLDGGAGNDTLKVHYAGRATTLRFGAGEGHDTLVQDAGTVIAVTIEFKSGMIPADVQLQRQSGLITISLSDGSTLSMAEANGITLKFADGMVLGQAQVNAMLLSADRSTATSQDDLLFGTAGADSITALAGNDAVYAADGADLVDGGTGNDTLVGGAGVDTLIGGAGSDSLDGGAGADVYRFARGFGQDVIGEVEDGAVDAVEFDATVAVSDVSVYRQVSGTTTTGLVLTLSATGDSVSAGTIDLVRFSNGTAWDSATTLSKIAGAVGSDADDTLSAPVTGSRLEGRGGNDTLNGSSGADTLDGGTGSDRMVGLAGNDTYYVDSLSDQVVEASAGGTDTAIVSIDNYVLAVEVERLEMAAGAAAQAATGNASANTLVGNDGANRLNGAAGADTLIGGVGNDTYVVDMTTDVVTEIAGAGIDSVESIVTLTLAANVENLYLMGSAKINGTGNVLNNLIVGNGLANSLTGDAGNDTLDGGVGTDTLIGGAGNDTYVINVTADVVNETVTGSGGVDTVNVSLAAAATYTLTTNVENAYVGNATAGVNLTGNAFANLLTGNAANNTLSGAAGADTLAGGGGNDTLTGGTEADMFVFDVAPAAGNIDTITDFQTGIDTIALNASLFSALGSAGTRIGLSDKLMYSSSTGVLTYDADGAGAGAAMTVAILGTSTHPSTLGSDFLLT